MTKCNLNRDILRLAIPSIVSNITVPLLGLVDTAIVGHMGDASYIGAIAVGSMIFNVMYWLLGFLRMSTGGLTAQAFGRDDRHETSQILWRSMALAMLCALTIIVLQVPLFRLALWFIGPEADVLAIVGRYLSICVYGAPAVLGLYVLNGWYVGMQNTRIPMYVSIVQNTVNIAVSLLLVYVFHMSIEGVAMGTLVAQWSGFLMSLACLRQPALRLSSPQTDNFLRYLVSGDFLKVNRDIFLRTIFLVAVNLYFVAFGAKYGAVILAVNTLLMQLFLLFSYVMDGFAYAAEALCGRYYGAGDREMLSRTVRRVFVWGGGVTVIYTLLYTFGGQPFLSLLTDEPSVVAASAEYLPWAMLIPVAGVATFVWDGVFIGLTMMRGMLLSTMIGALAFFAIANLSQALSAFHFSLFTPNHALWCGLVTYLFLRGAVQTVYYRKQRK